MYLATIAVLMSVWLVFWMRFHDPFHPLIVLLPQFAFLYGYMPFELKASSPDLFWSYIGGESGQTYQAIAMLLIGALIFGVVWATRGIGRTRAGWQILPLGNADLIRAIAALLGIAGLGAWLYMVQSSGGFSVAYGSAYGGGSLSSGYLREMRFVGLGGALLVYMTRFGRGMRFTDWALVLLCVTPTLGHALLGARRGPAFLGLITLVGGYIYFMKKRIPLSVVVAGAAAIGLFLLFLVANRNSIYIGSEVAEFRDPLEHVLRWESNEYLIGSAVFRYEQAYGAFYGMRELVWIVARLIPSAFWPTIYTDLPAMLGVNVDLRLNGGVSQQVITTISNWTPSVGSAEGFVGSLWLEFGVVAPFASFAIGWLYGMLWEKARYAVIPRVIYLLAATTSVYLVMQSLDPWLYRLILYGLPVWLILRLTGASNAAHAARIEMLGRHELLRQSTAPRAGSNQ